MNYLVKPTMCCDLGRAYAFSSMISFIQIPLIISCYHFTVYFLVFPHEASACWEKSNRALTLGFNCQQSTASRVFEFNSKGHEFETVTFFAAEK